MFRKSTMLLNTYPILRVLWEEIKLSAVTLRVHFVDVEAAYLLGRFQFTRKENHASYTELSTDENMERWLQ